MLKGVVVLFTELSHLVLDPNFLDPNFLDPNILDQCLDYTSDAKLLMSELNEWWTLD